MAEEVAQLCGPKHQPNGGELVRAGSSSGRVLGADVEKKNVFKSEEIGHWSLLCQAMQVVAKLAIDLFKRLVKLLLTFIVPHWRNQKRVAVGRNFELRVSRNLKNLQNRLINHRSQAVAMFGQFFDRRGELLSEGGTMYLHCTTPCSNGNAGGRPLLCQRRKKNRYGRGDPTVPVDKLDDGLVRAI